MSIWFTPNCDFQFQQTNKIKPHFTSVMSIFIPREMSFYFIGEMSVCITREMSVCITREMSIGVQLRCQFVLHARCNFMLEKRSFLNVLIRAFVICQFWCTSISPCQNAKIRNLSIYGFGTCSVIESFSRVFKSFRFTPKRFHILKTEIFFIR